MCGEWLPWDRIFCVFGTHQHLKTSERHKSKQKKKFNNPQIHHKWHKTKPLDVFTRFQIVTDWLLLFFCCCCSAALQWIWKHKNHKYKAKCYIRCRLLSSLSYLLLEYNRSISMPLFILLSHLTHITYTIELVIMSWFSKHFPPKWDIFFCLLCILSCCFLSLYILLWCWCKVCSLFLLIYWNLLSTKLKIWK